EDRAGALESGGRITHPLTRLDIPTSHLLRGLVGPREKRLCKRLQARFPCDFSFRPPPRPLRPIEILHPPLSFPPPDRMLERGVEFSLLTDAVEDGGPTLVQLAQIPQPLLDRTQLASSSAPVASFRYRATKGTVAPPSSNEMAVATCCWRTPNSSAMR